MRLGLPLQCNLGETCWVANYLDADASKAARDFLCRPRTYDGHDGVDFAIRDLGVMARGVPVLASALGVVKSMRDGVEDVAVRDEVSRARVKGRECGNGVLIQHSAGWQTQYCHLRRGSVRVKPGQQVAAGTHIGLVGLSGKTEFPHVHLAVRFNGETVDPFTGLSIKAGCGKPGQSLWRSDLGIEYEPVALYNAGIAMGQPDYEAIRKGERSDGPFSATAPALVMWVDMLGVQAGDRVAFRLRGPKGRSVIDVEQAVEKTQARRFIYVGSRRLESAWPAGTYAGEVMHKRTIEGKVRLTTIAASVSVK